MVAETFRKSFFSFSPSRFPSRRKQADKKNRISPLQLPVLFLVPDGEPLEQIAAAGIFHGKEFLQHAHIQGLAKPPGPCDQCHVISAFPPLPYEMCFVDIEIIIYYDFLKTLDSDSYSSGHLLSLLPNMLLHIANAASITESAHANQHRESSMV